MRKKKRFPCTLMKACYVKYLVQVRGHSMTEAAILAELNVGTVSHVIHGHRFPMAQPLPPSHFV